MTLDREVGYARANVPIDREVRVTLRSAYERARDVNVRLELPPGLHADTSSRAVSLAGNGVATHHLPRARHAAGGTTRDHGGGRERAAEVRDGLHPDRYAHIRPQMIVRPATMAIEAVDAQLPHGVSVAYVQGVGDNVAPMLAELGVPVTMLDAHALAAADLSRFTTVVIGTRAYEAIRRSRRRTRGCSSACGRAARWWCSTGSAKWRQPG